MEQVQITKGNKFGVVPMPAPFSHMLMEDNTDVGTGANAVTNIGTPTYTAGKLNNALTLDGTQALNVNALEQDIDTDTEGTISLWVKPSTLATSQVLFSLGQTATLGEFMDITISTTGFVQAGLFITALNHWILRSPVATAVIGEWLHIVITQDGVSPVMYINGVAITTLFVSNNPSYWFNNVAGLDNGRIGCGNWEDNGNFLFFTGQIDDFRYYQNQALNATQAAQIYNDGTGSQLTYPVGLTMPTAVLTQDTITEPTEQYEPVSPGITKAQAVIIV